MSIFSLNNDDWSVYTLKKYNQPKNKSKKKKKKNK